MIHVLRCMDTLVSYSARFSKEDKICVFVFAILHFEHPISFNFETTCTGNLETNFLKGGLSPNVLLDANCFIYHDFLRAIQ